MPPTFWDRIAKVYDPAERLNRAAVEGLCAFAVGLIPAGAEVLECAAGTGELSLAAAPRAGHVLCTDLSRPMLARAREKAARLGLTNIRFETRDLLDLPEEDGRFGVVIAANVLHLLARPDAAVKELWRVTAPGGALILPTFLTAEAGGGFRFVLRLYRLLGYRDRWAYTRESYRDLFRRLDLPLETYSVAEGRIPAGLAVLRRPRPSSLEVLS